ncbi:MAG: FliA/WhiG family RNA polymerase sigma factor [Oscillospiraceae bacterium]|nr:FliA/WhiG family RNA polymerase sigma factor [Oscillospiraceae bacterium]
MDKEQLSALWQRFKADGDQDAKNDLILHYVYLVKSIVRRMMPKYNAFNEYDDLVNSGVLGLIGAIDRFEPERNILFETYATNRIRGEILDYMRSQDWASPALRRRINSVSRAYEELEATEQRFVTETEVADRLNMPVTQVRDTLNQSHIFNIISFESTLSESGAVADFAAPVDEIPENAFLESELKSRLIDSINDLSERDRQIVSLYYYEGFMLKDIAEILGITEGRVSQLHSRIIVKMRKALVDAEN